MADQSLRIIAKRCLPTVIVEDAAKTFADSRAAQGHAHLLLKQYPCQHRVSSDNSDLQDTGGGRGTKV